MYLQLTGFSMAFVLVPRRVSLQFHNHCAFVYWVWWCRNGVLVHCFYVYLCYDRGFRLLRPLAQICTHTHIMFEVFGRIFDLSMEAVMDFLTLLHWHFVLQRGSLPLKRRTSRFTPLWMPLCRISTTSESLRLSLLSSFPHPSFLPTLPLQLLLGGWARASCFFGVGSTLASFLILQLQPSVFAEFPWIFVISIFLFCVGFSPFTFNKTAYDKAPMS